MRDMPILKSGAVFIADSHFRANQTTQQNAQTSCFLEDLSNSQKYPQWRGDILSLLEFYSSNPPSQVFLMGDIAHLLIGHIPSSIKANYPLIQAINALSQKCEVFYFEGNHDFGLDSSLFPNVKIYPRILQPACFICGDKIFSIAHGDCFLSKGYELYIRIMNLSIVLSIFKILDMVSCGWIYTYIAKKVNAKKIKSLHLQDRDFEAFAYKRIQKYNNYFQKLSYRIDTIIEGHFHIGQSLVNFFSLPSFYCCQRVFILEYEPNSESGENYGK